MRLKYVQTSENKQQLKSQQQWHAGGTVLIVQLLLYYNYNYNSSGMQEEEEEGIIEMKLRMKQKSLSVNGNIKRGVV